MHQAAGCARLQEQRRAAEGHACERVLVCVLAQTRGHRVTWPNYKSHFLDNLCPGSPEIVDLALAVAQEANTTGNGFYAHARYVWTYPEVDDWGAAFDDIQRRSNCSGDWRKLLQLGDQWLGGIRDERHQHPGSAAILLFFRWLLLHNLAAGGLLSRYDRFIVTRSDYFYGVLHPPLRVLPPQHIWIPDGEGWSGVTDRHIVIPRAHVAAVLSLPTDMVCDSEALLESMAHKSNWNLEQVIKFQLERKGLWPLTRFYPYVPFTTREPDEASRWFGGAYVEEAGMVIKYQSEYERYVAGAMPG